MKKASKRFRKAQEAVTAEKLYTLNDALEVLGGMPKTKFDETVELSVHLGVDPKHSDQMVRGTVKLPHGSGKKVRVLVFTENPQQALDAGAEYAGLKDLLEKIQGGWMDFDVAISTVSAMKDVRNVARVLGPRGLMPNPKSGTVSDDVVTAINDVKAGRVEYKMDKTANLAVVVGKRSFSNDKLAQNAQAAIQSIVDAKPENVKGHYIKSITLTATMAPGLRLDNAVAAR